MEGIGLIVMSSRHSYRNIACFAVTVVLFIVQMACAETPNTVNPLTDTPTGPKISDVTTTSQASPTKNNTATLTLPPTNTLPPTITSIPTPSASFVLASNANIRTGPGREYPVADGAQKGDTLPVYGRNEDGTWLVIDPINPLWVFVDLGTLSNPVDGLPIAPTALPTATYTPIPTNTLQPTRTPIPTSTPRPSSTPIPAVLLETIFYNFEHMTELQFQEYKAEIAGKPVREIVEVGNVDDDGRVIVHGPWSPILFNITDFCVVVTGTPKEIALTLNGGDFIDLEATINGIVGNYNYFFNCENTLVLYYKAINEE
jgi:hypothetical protein